MSTRDQYPPGVPCLVAAVEPDPDAAVRFYAGLFGWEAESLMPPDSPGRYWLCRLGGREVAAVVSQHGAPPPPAPVWSTHVSVESADDAAAKAKDLGAGVHAPPFDVMDAGRMAVIQDPQGAYFMAWEPRNHRGAGLVNAPGALSWNELASPDMDGSSEFYSGLFGWGLSPLENSPQPYLVIQVGERSNGGIRELAPPGTPPHWLPYFALDDVDSGLAKVEQLGGSTLVGSTDIGIAKIAVVQDPQGAYFAIYAGQLDP
jgi:uncharacterized protein